MARFLTSRHSKFSDICSYNSECELTSFELNFCRSKGEEDKYLKKNRRYLGSPIFFGQVS